jgi:hypothetical protein
MREMKVWPREVNIRTCEYEWRYAKEISGGKLPPILTTVSG